MTLQEEVSVLALHLRSCHTIDMHIRNKQSSVYSELGMLKYARMQFIVISITQNQITWNLIGINLLNIYIRGSFQKTFFYIHKATCSWKYSEQIVHLILGLNLQKCPIHLSGNTTLSLVKHRSLEKESQHPSPLGTPKQST